VVGPQTTRNGVVAIDPHTTRSGVAWDHSLAGTNDDMSRFGVMHPCGVGRSTEGDQKAEGQNRTHRICSIRPIPFLGGARAASPRSVPAPRSLKTAHAQQAGAAREHARSRANASHLTSAHGTPSGHQYFANVRFAPKSGRSSGKLQLFTFDATGAPECSCSRRSPGDAAALARISSTGRDEGLILAARPFTKRFGNVPASSATCSGDVEAMTIEFPSSPIGASPCEYSLKRRS
jgi:hypothetical protein